jgi:hypothetical protein
VKAGAHISDVRANDEIEYGSLFTFHMRPNLSLPFPGNAEHIEEKHKEYYKFV